MAERVRSSSSAPTMSNSRVATTLAGDRLMTESSAPELAHYYGDFTWNLGQTDWIKSLLLFFDGIALALPSAWAEEFIDSDPVLALPLTEQNLLRNFPPDEWLAVKADHILQLERLVEIFSDPHGPNDDLSADEEVEAEQLISSFWGGEDRYGKFVARAHEAARQFGGSQANTMALLAASRSFLLQQNITKAAIQPVIDDGNAAAYVAALIGQYPSIHAQVVLGDIANVGVNFESVPLDEVLDFRRMHGAEFRAYAQGVRNFVLMLSLMPDQDRANELADRRDELQEAANQLNRLWRTPFVGKASALAFNLAGAAWTLAHGDPWASAFAAGATAAGLYSSSSPRLGAAYSYLLSARAL
jgi:hypothetical protein